MLQLPFAQETLCALETPRMLVGCVSQAFPEGGRWLCLLREVVFLGRDGGTVSGLGRWGSCALGHEEESVCFLEKHDPSIPFRAHTWWHWAFH